MRSGFDCNDYFNEELPEKCIIFTGLTFERREEELKEMLENIFHWSTGLSLCKTMIKNIEAFREEPDTYLKQDIEFRNEPMRTYIAFDEYLSISRSLGSNLTQRVKFSKGIIKVRITKKIGIHLSFWPNKNKKHQASYNQDGKKIEIEYFWRENGTLELEVHHSEDGKEIWYDENGKIVHN